MVLLILLTNDIISILQSPPTLNIDIHTLIHVLHMHTLSGMSFCDFPTQLVICENFNPQKFQWQNFNLH